MRLRLRHAHLTSLGRPLFLAVLTVVLLAVRPSAAFAQARDAPPHTSLQRAIDRTVYVAGTSGVEVEGRLLSAAADAVVLETVKGQQQIAMRDVTRIQKRDSKRNGTLIGLGIGIGMGLIAGGISDCPGANPGGRCPGFRIGTAVTGAAVYTALGAGIDALIQGRETIYATSQAPRER